MINRIGAGRQWRDEAMATPAGPTDGGKLLPPWFASFLPHRFAAASRSSVPEENDFGVWGFRQGGFVRQRPRWRLKHGAGRDETPLFAWPG